MRTRKRTFPNFKYRECDAFAKYLQEQSLQGWHFQEWRFGLVFEKGEPKNIEYAVEIFLKGSEQDTRPDQDTEEYAEYCNAAGWTFLDAFRKFCIFRKDRADAVSIVEPEERFENIRKAEWRYWLNYSIIPIFLPVLYGLELWFLNFAQWIFSDLMLYIVVTMVILAIGCVGQGVYLLFWGRNRKQQLDRGNEIVYGRKYHIRVGWRYIVLIILYAGSVYLARSNSAMVFIFLGVILALVLINIGIAIWRPAALDNVIFQILAAVVILMIAIIMVITVNITMDQTVVEENVDMAPLKQEDYSEIEGNIQVHVDGMKGVLGYVYDCDVDYIQGDEENCLQYKVYHSPHAWIIDRIWEMESMDDPWQDCSEEWGAKRAYRFGKDGAESYWYQIHYENDVVMIRIYSAEELDTKDIAIIREKLALP